LRGDRIERVLTAVAILAVVLQAVALAVWALQAVA
jgi:hypothetical protein